MAHIKTKILDYSKDPYGIIADIVKQVTKHKKSGTALDIGPGRRGHPFFLSQKGFKVTVLDVSKKNLEALRQEAKKRKAQLRYVYSDVRKFRPRTKYDVVIARHILHFLKPKEIVKTIEAMKGYTKPKGINVVAVHTDKNPKGHRSKLFGKDELKKYYNGWEILYYHEGWGQPFRVEAGAKPVRRHKAELIARKP